MEQRGGVSLKAIYEVKIANILSIFSFGIEVCFVLFFNKLCSFPFFS